MVHNNKQNKQYFMNGFLSNLKTTGCVSVLTIALLNCTNLSAQVTIPADSLKKHVYFLADDSLEGRGLATPAGLKAAKYIAGYFKNMGLKPIGSNYLHPFYTKQSQTMLTGNNVVGLIEGSDANLKNEYIVIGAHFDHVAFNFKEGKKTVFNGADDNASGTAAIIELARALVQNKDRLKRSVVVVAFDGEECGLTGSFAFVEQRIIPVENIKLMMSIDMVGRYDKSNSLVVQAMASLKGGDELLFALAGKHGIKIAKTGKKISNRTDSKPFGLEGIPALHVTSGIIGNYHKPEDDAPTIDYKGMEKICGLLYDLTIDVANKESLQPIRSLTAMTKNEGLPFFRYGVVANVGGSYQSYAHEFFDGKGKFSAELGLRAQLKINNHFSLQPEALYSTSGSGFNGGNYRTHSISFPVSLFLSTKMSKLYEQRAYMYLGGYFSHHFSGSAAGQTMDFNKVFERNETGLVYGFGMEVMSVFVDMNFKFGLSNLLKDKNLGEISNRATYVTIGYMF
jgi:aminopeptidase YwaD